MNSLPRLVGRQLPEAQGGGVNYSLLSSVNPNGSNRELSIIAPDNMVLGTTEAQLSLQQNTQIASLVAQDNTGNVAASVSSMIEYNTDDPTPVPRVKIKADGIQIGNTNSSAGVTTSGVSMRALKGITVEGKTVSIIGHDSADNGVRIESEGKGIQIVHAYGTSLTYIIINQTGIHISGDIETDGKFKGKVPLENLYIETGYGPGFPPVGGLIIALIQQKLTSSSDWEFYDVGYGQSVTLSLLNDSQYPQYRGKMLKDPNYSGPVLEYLYSASNNTRSLQAITGNSGGYYGIFRRI